MPAPNFLSAGPRAATKNAVIGGVLLAAIEGLGIVITKVRLGLQALRGGALLPAPLRCLA
jgi:hypothetical protein